MRSSGVLANDGKLLEEGFLGQIFNIRILHPHDAVHISQICFILVIVVACE